MAKRISCIGIGTIGRGWAVKFASAGYDVVIHDQSVEVARQALGRIQAGLDQLARHGILTPDDRAAESISVAASLEEAIDGVDYVQESVPEQVGLKRRLYAAIDELIARSGRDAPVIGSSTSELAGSSFMGGFGISPSCLVVHPVNPPSLVPLVELCRTPETSDAAIDYAERLMLRLAQEPIHINREIPGFVLNRLQAAVLGEALHLVGEGVCSPDAIDKAIKHGLGLRWAFMGPFETGHLNAPGGFRDYMERYGGTYRSIMADLNVNYPWGELLIARIDKECRERAGDRPAPDQQAWRDDMLIRLRQLLGHARDELSTTSPAGVSENKSG